MIVFTLYLLLVSCAQGSEQSSPYFMVSNYLKNHSTFQRPVVNESSTLQVKVNMNLMQLTDLDETRQQLHCNSWFYFVWEMENLTWDPVNYQNITRVHVMPSDIYLPDLVMVNAVEKMGSFYKYDLPATVWHNGTTELYVHNVMSTTCKVDVSFFPFDKQRCAVQLSQWFTFTTEVQYSFMKPPITFRSFEENGEWKIIHHAAHINMVYDGLYQLVEFELTLQRRSAYYVMTAVLPMCVLSFLNMLVFKVPPGSGERLSLGISIFLSYAVFLTTINGILPSVSDHVALFNVYLNCMLVLKGLTIVATIFVLNLQRISQSSVWYKYLAQKMTTMDRKGSGSSSNLRMTSLGKSVENNEQRSEIIQKTDHLLFLIFCASFLVISGVFLTLFLCQ